MELYKSSLLDDKFIYLVNPIISGVLWFAKITATRSDFALRALRSLRELKGLNARQLAFSRQACLNQITLQSSSNFVYYGK